jgi:hypothetical protein
MGYSTVVSEVLTVPESDSDVVKGLKALKGKIRGKDMSLLAMKVNRDVYTIRAYLRGEVRDEVLGLQILNYANGFIALNNNCDFLKNRLVY